MKNAHVFDCEFLTTEGAPSRFWCGPYDPDPVIAQIGIVRLGLSEGFQIADRLRIYVIPKNRDGTRIALDPFFTRLTGITDEIIDAEGVPLAEALQQAKSFSDGGKLWSWGKDELNMMAISCFVEGLTPPIPATRFGNACNLLLKAGMPYEDITKTRSNTLAAYYGFNSLELHSHDALDDALSVAYVLQHLLRTGKLVPVDFA